MGKNPAGYNLEDRVNHSVYGLGTIVDVNPVHITINFDEAGPKKFVTSMVQLSPSDTEAPPKRTRKKRASASKSSSKTS